MIYVVTILKDRAILSPIKANHALLLGKLQKQTPYTKKAIIQILG